MRACSAGIVGHLTPEAASYRQKAAKGSLVCARETVAAQGRDFRCWAVVEGMEEKKKSSEAGGSFQQASTPTQETRCCPCSEMARSVLSSHSILPGRQTWEQCICIHGAGIHRIFRAPAKGSHAILPSTDIRPVLDRDSVADRTSVGMWVRRRRN